MRREIVFRLAARIEFDEAVAWYEGEKAGLGLALKTAVDHTLTAASQQPELFRRIHGPVRRAVLRRFPYSLHFMEEPARLVVLAVFHGSRDPRHLRERG
jgi:plasmid stabilization system protein ParE